MKRYILLLITILAPVIGAIAQDFQSVELRLKDMSTVRIDMKSGLRAHIADGQIVFVHPDGEISFPSSDVKSWKFSTMEGDDLLSVMGSPTTPASVISWGSNVIMLSNLVPSSTVTLYNAGGALILSGTVSQDGEFCIATSSLVHGVYILSFGKSSVKIAI